MKRGTQVIDSVRCKIIDVSMTFRFALSLLPTMLVFDRSVGVPVISVKVLNVFS